MGRQFFLVMVMISFLSPAGFALDNETKPRYRCDESEHKKLIEALNAIKEGKSLTDEESRQVRKTLSKIPQACFSGRLEDDLQTGLLKFGYAPCDLTPILKKGRARIKLVGEVHKGCVKCALQTIPLRELNRTGEHLLLREGLAYQNENGTMVGNERILGIESGFAHSTSSLLMNRILIHRARQEAVSVERYAEVLVLWFRHFGIETFARDAWNEWRKSEDGRKRFTNPSEQRIVRIIDAFANDEMDKAFNKLAEEIGFVVTTPAVIPVVDFASELVLRYIDTPQTKAKYDIPDLKVAWDTMKSLDIETTTKFSDHFLLDWRNVPMSENILNYLCHTKRPNIAVLVGAAHLPGLYHLLRDALDRSGGTDVIVEINEDLASHDHSQRPEKTGDAKVDKVLEEDYQRLNQFFEEFRNRPRR